MAETAAAVERAGSRAVTVRTDVSRRATSRPSPTAPGASAARCTCSATTRASRSGAGSTTATHQDWEWAIGVNLWGVIHGVEAFVPRMIAQKTAGHIVNTASMAGLIASQGLGVYNTTKYAVVGLSETLQKDLRAHRIGVSVLCPMGVKTAIRQSARSRPDGAAQSRRGRLRRRGRADRPLPHRPSTWRSACCGPSTTTVSTSSPTRRGSSRCGGASRAWKRPSRSASECVIPIASSRHALRASSRLGHAARRMALRRGGRRRGGRQGQRLLLHAGRASRSSSSIATASSSARGARGRSGAPTASPSTPTGMLWLTDDLHHTSPQVHAGG